MAANLAEALESKQDMTPSVALQPALKSHGHFSVDTLFKELAEALAQKQIEKLSAFHAKIENSLLVAYQNNNPELYVYIVQRAVEFCIRAFEQNQIDKIAIVFGFEHEDAATITQLLGQQKYKLLTFAMINSEGYLEIFSELLKKDKKEIQPFKEAVYQVFARLGQDCRPNEEEIVESIGNFAISLQKFLKNTVVIHLDPFNELGWLNTALLEHLFFTQQHVLFSRAIQMLLNTITKALQDKFMNGGLNVSLEEVLHGDYFETGSLFNRKFLPYLIYTSTNITADLLPALGLHITRNILGDISRSDNVETKNLIEYVARIEEIIAGTNQHTLEKDPEQLLARLQQACSSKDLQAARTQAIKLLVLSQSFFETNNSLEFSKLVFGISKIMLELASEEKLKILVAVFGLNADEIERLKIISANKKLDLICYDVLKMLLHDSDIALDYNVAPKAIAEFSQNVEQQISLLLQAENHPSLLQPLEFLNEKAKRALTQKEDALKALQVTCLEGQNQLHNAFINKDEKCYANIVKNTVDILLFARQEKKLALFFSTLKIELAVVSDISDALDKNDFPALHKIFTDFLLREDVAEHVEQNNDKHAEINKTQSRVFEAKHREEQSFIEFQKAIYRELSLPTEANNLGKIIVSSYESLTLSFTSTTTPVVPTPPVAVFYSDIKTAREALSFERYKAYAATARQHLKNAFLANNTEEFANIMCELVSLFSMAAAQGRMDKVGQLLDGLTSPVLGFHTQKEKKLLRSNNALISLLLSRAHSEPQSAALLNFILVDLLDFSGEFSTWGLNKQNMIASFKSAVVEKLNSNHAIDIPDQKAISEYFLNTHLRYALLAYQNHPNQRETKDRLRFIATILLGTIDGFQVSVQRNIIDISRFFLNSSSMLPPQRSVVPPDLMVALFNPEVRPFMAWSLLYSRELTNIDNLARQNGLSLEATNQFKMALGGVFALKLGREELLRDYAQLHAMLEVELKKDLDLSSKQKLTLILLEINALLIEQVCTLDKQAFAKTLTAFAGTLQQNQKLLEIFVCFFLRTTEEHADLMCIAKYGDRRLLARHFIELINKNMLTNRFACGAYNIPEASLQLFIKETLREIAVLEPTIQEVDFTTIEDAPKRNYLQLALGLQIRDAYYFDNPQQFAHLMKQLTQLLQTLFTEGKHLALIQVLELNSENSNTHLYYKTFVRVEGLATKLSLEDICHSLTAGNLNGLTKLLIDAFINKCSENLLGKTTDSTKFKQAVYDTLEIIPLDLYTPAKTDVEKDKDFIVASIRKLANQAGVSLERYEDIFESYAKLKPIVMALPKPDATDTERYRQTYAKMHEAWHNHLIAHRFGITGEMLEGSYSITMMQELQCAYENFLTNPNSGAAFSAAKAVAFSDMSQGEWEKIALQIKTDISRIILKPQEVENPNQVKIDQTVAMPLFLDLEGTEGHLTAVIFFKFRGQDYCILTDKSLVITKSSGLEIQAVTRPDQIPVTISAIAKIYISKGCNAGITLAEWKAIVQPLGLKLSKVLAKKPQKSGNCGWSSSAKMSAFSLIFVNMLKGLEARVCTVEEAMDLANQATIPIYKPFTFEDRKISLQNYLIYCRQTNMVPHALMMAQILLKNEQHPERKAIIEVLATANIVISEADKSKAGEALLQSTIEFLLYKSKIKNRDVVPRNEIEALAIPVLNAYLTHQPETQFSALLASTVSTLQNGRELIKEEEDLDEKHGLDVPLAVAIHTPPVKNGTKSFGSRNRTMVFSSGATGTNGTKSKAVLPTRASSTQVRQRSKL